MPLVDKRKRVSPGLGMLGKIRLGLFDKQANHPVSLDYFRFDETSADLISLYGEEARELKVMSPFDDPERIVDGHYELWGKSGLKCRGDGARVPGDGQGIMKALDPDGRRQVQFGAAHVDFEDGQKDGEWYTFETGEFVPCSGESRDLYPKCAECRAVIRMKFIVRDPRAEMGRGIANDRPGYYLVTTGSGFSYSRVLERLLWIEGEVEKANGAFAAQGSSFRLSLMMVPLILRRGKANLPYEDKDLIERRRDLDVIYLDIDPVWSTWLKELNPSFLDLPERDIPLLAEGVTTEEGIIDVAEAVAMDDFTEPVEGEVVPDIPPMRTDRGGWGKYFVDELNVWPTRDDMLAWISDKHGVDVRKKEHRTQELWEALHVE